MCNDDLTHLEVEDARLVVELSGEGRRNLKSVERALRVGIDQRGNVLLLSGSPKGRAAAQRLIEQFLDLLRAGRGVPSLDLLQEPPLPCGAGVLRLHQPRPHLPVLPAGL